MVQSLSRTFSKLRYLYYTGTLTLFYGFTFDLLNSRRIRGFVVGWDPGSGPLTPSFAFTSVYCMLTTNAVGVDLSPWVWVSP